MFHGLLQQVSRNVRAILHQGAGDFIKYNSVLAKPLLGPGLPIIDSQLLNGPLCINATKLRGFHNSCSVNLYNTQQLKNDPCKTNSDPCQPQCPPQEPEECTITPCCRPFRLQKEHPMKNLKKDECKKEEKKPEPVKKPEAVKKADGEKKAEKGKKEPKPKKISLK